MDRISTFMMAIEVSLSNNDAIEKAIDEIIKNTNSVASKYPILKKWGQFHAIRSFDSIKHDINRSTRGYPIAWLSLYVDYLEDPGKQGASDADKKLIELGKKMMSEIKVAAKPINDLADITKAQSSFGGSGATFEIIGVDLESVEDGTVFDRDLTDQDIERIRRGWFDRVEKTWPKIKQIASKYGKMFAQIDSDAKLTNREYDGRYSLHYNRVPAKTDKDKEKRIVDTATAYMQQAADLCNKSVAVSNVGTVKVEKTADDISLIFIVKHKDRSVDDRRAVIERIGELGNQTLKKYTEIPKEFRFTFGKEFWARSATKEFLENKADAINIFDEFLTPGIWRMGNNTKEKTNAMAIDAKRYEAAKKWMAEFQKVVKRDPILKDYTLQFDEYTHAGHELSIQLMEK